MIVNANELLYVVVELDDQDMVKILDGEEVIMRTRALTDEEDVLVRVYCSDPDSARRKIKNVNS